MSITALGSVVRRVKMNQAIAFTLEPRRAVYENHDVSIQKPSPRAEQM